IALALPCSLQAQTKQAQPNQERPKIVHLGVETIKVPSVLHAQMPDSIPKGEGVLILWVEKDSPASKAGLQVDDVVLSLDGKKIHSPRELADFVHGDKAGQQVKVAYLRGGKQMTATATLTETDRRFQREGGRIFRLAPDDPLRKSLEDWESKTDTSFWN